MALFIFIIFKKYERRRTAAEEKEYLIYGTYTQTFKGYEAYHNLGGNDVATELYNKVMKMPEASEHDT